MAKEQEVWKSLFSGLSGLLELAVLHRHNRSGVILAAGDTMAAELLGISYQQHPQMSRAFELRCDFI